MIYAFFFWQSKIKYNFFILSGLNKNDRAAFCLKKSKGAASFRIFSIKDGFLCSMGYIIQTFIPYAIFKESQNYLFFSRSIIRYLNPNSNLRISIF